MLELAELRCPEIARRVVEPALNSLSAGDFDELADLAPKMPPEFRLELLRRSYQDESELVRAHAVARLALDLPASSVPGGKPRNRFMEFIRQIPRIFRPDFKSDSKQVMFHEAGCGQVDQRRILSVGSALSDCIQATRADVGRGPLHCAVDRQ